MRELGRVLEESAEAARTAAEDEAKLANQRGVGFFNQLIGAGLSGELALAGARSMEPGAAGLNLTGTSTGVPLSPNYGTQNFVFPNVSNGGGPAAPSTADGMAG
jgi:hypothetical protein